MTEIEEKLLALAAESANRSQPDVLFSIRETDWDDPEAPYDWRKYVPDNLRSLWTGLPVSARLALFVNAEVQREVDF